jgi:hypothetical protein
MTKRSIALLLLASTLTLDGCKSDDPPSAWEIIQGTASLTASKSLHPDSNTVLGDFPSRTGSLVVADDSTVTGWIRMAAGDTIHITDGIVTREGDLLMTLPGLTPAEYTILTDGDFPGTYGLLSTSAVTGGDVGALHKVYWQFER